MTRVADTLITPRMVLRLPKAGDLPAYAAYCASDRSVHVGGPFAASKAFEKFAAMTGHWTLRGFGRYVMERNGDPIGHAGPMQPDDGTPPDMTWTLWSGGHEGQGLATEAAQAVLHHLLVDCGWPRLIARIQPDNAASLRMAERLGARETGDAAPAWYPGAVTYTFEGAAA